MAHFYGIGIWGKKNLTCFLLWANKTVQWSLWYYSFFLASLIESWGHNFTLWAEIWHTHSFQILLDTRLNCKLTRNKKRLEKFYRITQWSHFRNWSAVSEVFRNAGGAEEFLKKERMHLLYCHYPWTVLTRHCCSDIHAPQKALYQTGYYTLAVKS